MTFYVQLAEENKITDIITYPHEGYIQVELSVPLPMAICGGVYQLVDNQLVYRADWDTQTSSSENSDVVQGVLALMSMGVEVPVEAMATASERIASVTHLMSPEDDEEWKTKTYYSSGTIVTYASKRYICITSHISQDNWNPTVVPALWSEFKEEFAEWVQPQGAHDAYRIGDKVTFQGKKYVSTVDSNVWAPNVAGWSEIT